VRALGAEVRAFDGVPGAAPPHANTERSCGSDFDHGLPLEKWIQRWGARTRARSALGIPMPHTRRPKGYWQQAANLEQQVRPPLWPILLVYGAFFHLNSLIRRFYCTPVQVAEQGPNAWLSLPLAPLLSSSVPSLAWQVRDFQMEHGLPFSVLPARAVMVQKGEGQHARACSLMLDGVRNYRITVVTALL